MRRVAIRLRNRGEQTLNELPGLRLLRLLMLPGSPRCRVGHQDHLLGKVGHSHLTTPALLSKIIIRRVHRQAVEPRVKNIRRPELVQGKVKPEKHLLPDVLDVLAPPDEPGNRAQNPPPGRQNDLVERRVISALRAFDQLCVNQHAMPARLAFGRYLRLGVSYLAGPRGEYLCSSRPWACSQFQCAGSHPHYLTSKGAAADYKVTIC